MSSEQRGFVFSLTFIIMFSVLLSTIPIGLQGLGLTPDMVTPLDPAMITDFSDSTYFVRANFSFMTYLYDLGGRSWICGTDDISFNLAAKILVAGFLWLGGIDLCKLTSSAGTNRGTALSLDEIQADAIDGTVRYSLQLSSNGNDGGNLIVYWNITEYANASDAWFADGLYLLHGIGIDNTATANIGVLLIGLLTLQLPDVPLLVNVFIAVPIWAGIIYILWYIIKEMIPFV